MTDPNVPPPIRKGRGCFFYGCLTSLVLLLVVFLLALFTVRWIRNEINAYTDTAPMTLPKVEMA